MKSKRPLLIRLSAIGALWVLSFVALASGKNISTISTTITTQAHAIAKLLSVTAYIAGVGFSLAGVLQFKGHKENPQQTPLSKPVVMIVVAACLLYLPTVLNIAGTSVFGDRALSAAKAGGLDGLGEE